eukprot:sb/3476968/
MGTGARLTNRQCHHFINYNVKLFIEVPQTPRFLKSPCRQCLTPKKRRTSIVQQFPRPRPNQPISQRTRLPRKWRIEPQLFGGCDLPGYNTGDPPLKLWWCYRIAALLALEYI